MLPWTKYTELNGRNSNAEFQTRWKVNAVNKLGLENVHS